jgi:DNA-binding NarL/FixJ family response regulator
MNRKISVLLADDQLLFVRGLSEILRSQTEDIRVAGVAFSGTEAVTLAEELHPDVVLMDVRMPELDGVEATRAIHAKHPDIRIMMLTTFDDDDYVQKAIEYGAVGYVLKDITPDELIADIRALTQGSTLVSRSIAKKFARAAGRRAGEPVPSWVVGLSEQHRRIAKLIGEGYDNKRIAETIFLAEQTVRNYASQIYDKIGVHDRLMAFREIQKARDFLGPE